MNELIDNFHFQTFQTNHFNEYSTWFEDPLLKETLGGIDQEWLEYILNDEKGIELAVLQNNELIAVIGLNYPNTEEKSYAITNIALKPELRNKGLGSQVLSALIKCFTLKDDEYWTCYVDKNNPIGQHFFEKNGWIKHDNDDNMIKYTI